MGMNMVTIAAQAIGEWIEKNVEGLRFVTVAGNVDSDKKPSKRTHALGRGFEVITEATLTPEIIASVLKSTPEAMLEVAKTKLEIGSSIAGAIGSNLHAANIIAALYLATGQDAAHVVEGSMADTTVSPLFLRKGRGARGEGHPQDPLSQPSPPAGGEGICIRTRIPALMIGIRGGGTTLPAQAQCLKMLLGRRPNLQSPISNLHPSGQLAEAIAAAVLAGELSLLAAQASHELTRAHQDLSR